MVQGSCSKWQGTAGNKGFTLIELTVVIVILGVVLTLIIPRLADLGEANLKRSSRHLTGMIRFLRDEAQSKKELYRLKFDIQAGLYWTEVLRRTQTQTGDQLQEFKRLQTTMATEGELSGQTAFSDIHAGSHPDEPYIQFTPDGWVEKTYIHLRDGDNKPFTLIVNPLMGDTELHEGYLEAKQ